jgi:thiaminase (transcriptional activator TenA)
VTEVAAALWRQNADLAARALAHPFVRGIADGSLPSTVFADYIGQDAYFLESFAHAYARAGEVAEDQPSKAAFAELGDGVRRELQLHRTYAADLGIDLTSVQPVAATRDYTDFLTSTSQRRGVAAICAAMTPCMRLYAHLGRSLDNRPEGTLDHPEATHVASWPPHTPYVEWIRTYADPEFQALASHLEGLLNRHAEDVGNVQKTYRQAMELELAFFDAAMVS